ncbi:phosphoadenosine phosphosulfate reductase family protein [Streptomyces noursei]|uniref:phosphoadenosine phosphosulfate reductase family protein n=1 Tax=Streptomyces noursei TaxID=1971 RepID=UPI00344B6151
MALTPAKMEDNGEALASLTLDEAVERSHAIIDRAISQTEDDGKEVTAVCALFSGGNDSTTMLHLVRDRVTHAVHVNTTIGIEQTREFVRTTTADMNIPLIEAFPPNTYDELVRGEVIASKGKHQGEPVWKGFPGPAGHQMMYTRLKERALRTVRNQFVSNPFQQRIIFLAGMRVFESPRRWRNANEIDREGSIVWASPIVHWTNSHMRDYRALHQVPHNEVSDLLHMSGECLCGAFAKPGELDEIADWFPEAAKRIRDLEAEVQARGITACKWGQRPPKQRASPAGRLCTTCEWAEEGAEPGPSIAEWAADPSLTRRAA